MIIKRYIIVDTSFLDAIYRLKLFQHINLLYSRVLISVAVEEEFLSDKNPDQNERYRFISQIFSLYYWVEKCTTYDATTVKLIQAEPYIDKGEAEVMAQTQKLANKVYEPESLISVIDEKRGRAVAENMGCQLTGTLYILAMLSLHGFNKYESSIKFLKEVGVRYSTDVVKLAYEKANNDFKSGGFKFHH